MTAFTLIIFILFVGALISQFLAAVERDCLSLAFLFAFEILAFAYLTKVLM